MSGGGLKTPGRWEVAAILWPRNNRADCRDGWRKTWSPAGPCLEFVIWAFKAS
jgi:hypothetical protein